MRPVDGNLRGCHPERKEAIDARVAYYDRLSATFELPSTAEPAGDFSFAGKSTAYCFDFRNLIQPYHKHFMSIEEQLQHQFVVSVEGIDVATNLKWIMASNSLCLMRRHRFETWFMEGALVPGYHYVELADDHSDLPEKIRYYQDHHCQR
jgi:hypothetical protein